MWISNISIGIRRLIAITTALSFAAYYTYHYSLFLSGLLIGSLFTVIFLTVIAIIRYGLSIRRHTFKVGKNTYEILDQIFITNPSKNVRVLKNILFDARTSSMYFNNESWSYGDLIRKYIIHNNMSIDRALVLGGGGGSVAIELLKNKMANHVDVVEKSSQMIRVAKKYFVPETIQNKINFIHEDGKKYIEKNTVIYNFIFVDMFYHQSIPDFSLKPAFIQKLKKSTSKRGVVYTNFGFAYNPNLTSVIPQYKKCFSHFTFFMNHKNLIGLASNT